MSQHTGLCLGCYRTLDEIAGWSAMDDDARRAVWGEIAARSSVRAEPVEAPQQFDKLSANGEGSP